MIDQELKNEQHAGTEEVTDGLDTTLTEAEVKLAACQMEADQLKEQLLRERADFENYKKRVERERVQWIKSGQSLLLMDLLNVVDNLDRASAELDKKERTPEMNIWVQGFEMTGKELYKVLSKYGVQPMEYEKTFNPERHEGLVQVDSPDHESGQVVAILQKGFLINNEVLRPAKVSVAK